jgi:two-component system chemotaxis response regulator CheB
MLPQDYPIPIVIVQHITADFLPSMVRWLDMVSPLHVTVAQAGERPQQGNVYLAPGTSHLLIELTRRFAFDTVSPERPLPSGDILLKSVARAYGSRAVGMVLTGMGSDGADGLRAMYDAGAFTIAQDEETSAVYGMPREAVARGGVHRVLALADMPAALLEMAGSKKERLS